MALEYSMKFLLLAEWHNEPLHEQTANRQFIAYDETGAFPMENYGWNF